MEKQSTENVVPEQKPHNKNLPIIIAAIVAGVLLIFAITFAIIANLNNKKPETPEQPEEINEATSYVILDTYYINEDLEEFIGSTNIITSYLELQDFYDEISAQYSASYVLDCTDELEETDCENYIDPSLIPGEEPFDRPSELDEEFFDSNDLLVTKFDSAWCGGGFNRIRNVNKDDNVVTIEIGYDGGCGPCAIETYVIFVEVEKDFAEESDTFETEEVEENDQFCDPTVAEKPMIYLYPKEETEISVKLGKPELLTTTYPKHNTKTGWQVIAKPDGTLISGDREYYGLYWEGINKAEQKDKGFIVAGEDTAKFLEEKLETFTGYQKWKTIITTIFVLPLAQKLKKKCR